MMARGWMALTCVCGFGWMTASGGAEVGVGDVVTAGGTVCVPVTLKTGILEDVAGLQFDLVFDEGVTFESVALGMAGRSASKEISFNAHHSGRVRVIIAGLNRNTIPNGMIADVCFGVSGREDGRRFAIGLEGVILSDPYGMRVDARAHGGTVVIGEAAVAHGGPGGSRGADLLAWPWVLVTAGLAAGTLGLYGARRVQGRGRRAR